MTVLQFLRDPTFGCATTAEIVAFQKRDNAGFQMLKQWARDEMTNRGIAVTEQ